MDTKSTRAEGLFELAEKYRNWTIRYLPAGGPAAIYDLGLLLDALNDKRLKAAHDAAVAGCVAEKLLAHINPAMRFHHAAEKSTQLLRKRGLIKDETAVIGEGSI